MKRYLPLLLLAVGVLGRLTAQPGLVNDLTQDKAFFERQSEIYQRWLDKAGLGNVLYVKDVQVEPKSVSLYLAFQYAKLDSIVSAWDQLENAFQQEGGLSLEQTLFYKWVNLIEVRQGLANVQVYDTYDLRREPLFFRGIYFEDGRVQIETSDPKSKTVEFLIPLASGLGKGDAQGQLPARSRQELFDKTLAFAQERFQQTNCPQRYPEVHILENDQVLRFEVTDLCREVLIDEAQPFLCSVLKGAGISDCNWVKRELLTFTMACSPAGNQLKVTLDIDGKYGSGLYEHVRRGGYLSMEIDFDEYLERYAQTFKEDLKRHLR